MTNEFFATGELKKSSGSRTYPVEYTYDAAGRMATRTWARTVGGQPLVTAYGYNGAGEVGSVDYSDSTPDVSFGYNRRGQQTTVTASGVTTAMAYNIPGQLLAESYTGGPLDGLSVTNGYDDLLRRTSVSINNQLSTINSTAYGYDAASRLSTVGEGTNSATYSYLANSPLVENITFKQGAATRMTTTKSYDLLNRLNSIQSINSQPSTINSFSYAYNSANQRTAVTNADASRWNFGYDTLGQVTSGKKRWSDGTLVAGEQFEYTFDDIGNRKQSRYGGDANGSFLRRFNYSVNPLNQYTSRSAGPGTTRYANILGEATNAATVTVNNQAPYRRGDFFRLELAVTNTAPVWLGVTNIAVLNQGTNVDLIATNAGNVFVPPTPEAFGYDADGNMTNDGRFTLTWDAENRLVKVESLSSAPTGSKRKVEWTFDGLGRRVRQVESIWNASTNDYQLSTDIKIVSDGWRNIAELNVTNNAMLRTYSWGLDLSGSLGGAGGVGGLLMINSAAQGTHFYAMDGNGNTAALVSAATGTASANYEYEPFGVTLRATGPMALENPFRFSTKRASDATDWVLYEYRIYNPAKGKWLSKDPIGERGGVSIYGFVGNDPMINWDLLGLDTGFSGTVKLWSPDPKQNFIQNNYWMPGPVPYYSGGNFVESNVINPFANMGSYFANTFWTVLGDVSTIIDHVGRNTLGPDWPAAQAFLAAEQGSLSALNNFGRFQGFESPLFFRTCSSKRTVDGLTTYDPIWGSTGSKFLDSIGLEGATATNIRVWLNPNLSGANLINTIAHEGFHVSLLNNYPTLAISSGRLPYIGAFPLYVEEVAAYTTGALGAGQYGHGQLLAAPISAFGSLSAGQNISLFGTGAAIGGLGYYNSQP